MAQDHREKENFFNFRHEVTSKRLMYAIVLGALYDFLRERVERHRYATLPIRRKENLSVPRQHLPYSSAMHAPGGVKRG